MMKPMQSRVCRALVRRWAHTIRVTPSPWDRLHAELDRWLEQPAQFWWRDDDVVTTTPEFERLVSLRQTLGLPLALAVIPAGATAALGRAVAADPSIHVLVHGWDHRNHSSDARHPNEFDAARTPQDVERDLTAGRLRLNGLFGGQALPVLVPPFNRFSPHLSAAVIASGLKYVSADQDFAGHHLPTRDVHVDVINWRHGSAISACQAVQLLIVALRLRRYGLVPRSKPIGVMTHHLAHDEAVWSLTAELLTRLATHRRAVFPLVSSVFS